MLFGVSRRETTAEGDVGSKQAITPATVREQLARMLENPEFRFSERLSRFLKFVVEQQLAGNAGQLKETVLAVAIFDREPTYDTHVHSIVRVEARRLRTKIERYYGSTGRSDPIIIALPKGSYAPIFALRDGLQVTEAGAEAPPAKAVLRRARRGLLIAGMAAAGLLLGVVFTLRFGPNRSAPPLPLRRFTADAGLTFEPALSPDGKLVAYSSDRAGDGRLDIWVQQLADAPPVRVTSSPGEDREPAFSPDGTQIAYRAEGENPGIYLVPALGGMSTLLAAEGSRPYFSPDGTRVLYWKGERSFRTAEIWVVPAKGGSPLRLQSSFPYAAYPVWSPDGQYVLFVGSKDPSPQPWITTADDWDWWLAPVAGGPAVQTFARKAFAHQALQPPQTGWSHRRIVPSAWSPSSDVVFAARTGDRMNIWRIPISVRTGRVTGPARQVTFGAGRQDYPSVSSDGTIAFSVLTSKSDIYTLPLAADTAQVHGPVSRLTSDAANYTRPVVSRDGNRLAFISNRAGNYDVWAKDLKSGKETAVTTTRQDESVTVISDDGSKLAFGYAPPLNTAICIAGVETGKAARLCSDCGEPRAWLPDGTGLLFQRFNRPNTSIIGLLDLAGHERLLMQSTSSGLFSPSVSPDGRWIALIVRTPPDDHRVMVAPMAGGNPKDWVSVTPPGVWVDKPRWSPNGRVIYYFGTRDGFLCLWAQRVDPAAKTPTGAPVGIAHFHSRHSPGSVFGMELSVAADKLVFNIGEESGNVWLTGAGR